MAVVVLIIVPIPPCPTNQRYAKPLSPSLAPEALAMSLGPDAAKLPTVWGLGV